MYVQKTKPYTNIKHTFLKESDTFLKESDTFLKESVPTLPPLSTAKKHARLGNAGDQPNYQIDQHQIKEQTNESVKGIGEQPFGRSFP